jgi:periplasmic divalent cation tolerance protein
MDSKDTFQLVLVTAPDLETARILAKALVTSKIAACVNISPGLVSIYSWEDELQEDQEVLLLVKTRQNLIKNQLIPLVHELHPYDLPEIIALPIQGGSQAYLQWICDETGGNAS